MNLAELTELLEEKNYLIKCLEKKISQDETERVDFLRKHTQILEELQIARAENIELMDVNIYEHSVAEAAKQELVKLTAGYKEAVEDIESWGAYASVYFQEKHDLAGCIFEHKKILNIVKPNIKKDKDHD